MNDYYDHIDPSLEYLLENTIYTIDPENTDEDFLSYNELVESYNTSYTKICNCVNNCSKKCVECYHGGNYIEIKVPGSKTELVLNAKRDNKDLLFECFKCKCKLCKNRLVQYGPRKNLEIININHLNKGLGLITKEFIPQGGFICEYIGEVLTKKEAQRRHKINEQLSIPNYIICLNEFSLENKTQIQTFIDPSKKGNIGRYLNHSCNPNCEIISVRIDGPQPKIGIFAKQNILPLQELCFDYSDGYSNVDPKSSLNKKKRIKCFCLSENCTTYLPFNLY